LRDAIKTVPDERIVHVMDRFDLVSLMAAFGASRPFGVLESKCWFPPSGDPRRRYRESDFIH
jgi:hypothetical protein